MSSPQTDADVDGRQSAQSRQQVAPIAQAECALREASLWLERYWTDPHTLAAFSLDRICPTALLARITLLHLHFVFHNSTCIFLVLFHPFMISHSLAQGKIILLFDFESLIFSLGIYILPMNEFDPGSLQNIHTRLYRTLEIHNHS